MAQTLLCKFPPAQIYAARRWIWKKITFYKICRVQQRFFHVLHQSQAEATDLMRQIHIALIPQHCVALAHSEVVSQRPRVQSLADGADRPGEEWDSASVPELRYGLQEI